MNVITNPVANIPINEKSHTLGWTKVWASHLSADINHKCTSDVLNYDKVFVDFGANYSGSLNLFGGANQELFERLNLIMQCKNVASLDWPFELSQSLRKRINAKTTYEGFNDEWFDKLEEFEKNVDVIKQEKYSHLSDRELELFTEGFFSDVINKFKTVATQGIKIFVNWVKGVFGKIYRTIAGNSQKDINKLINNKAMQAANNLLQKSRMSNLVEQKIKNDGRTKQELSLVKTLVKNINKVHTDNVRLVQRLNSRPKMKARPRQPILFVGAQTGLIDEGTIIKQLEKIEKQKDIAREDFKIAVTITSNFAANIAVNAILKNVEREVVKYEDLTESLFAFSSTLDAEARFGNTALPLVVCYGGQSGKNLVLGKRDDFTKTNANEMLQKGKQLNNFYVAVIEIDRVRGKDYNSASVHLVTGFKDENGKPFPIYQKMTIANSSGSKFTTKLEIDAFSPAKKVREWAA